MLIPPPEADLVQSPLVAGADILESLMGKDGVVVEDVMLQFLDRFDQSSPDDFLDSLCCLFALGLLEYNSFKLKERPK